MSEQQPPAAVNARGAVDLSQLADQRSSSGQRSPAPGQPAPQQGQHAGGHQSPGGADSWAVAVQPADLQQVLQLSAQVPLLVLMHDTSDVSEQFRTTLTDAVDRQRGRIVLACIDASAYPEIAQQAGSLPVVTAFLAGRPIGEFDAQAPADQLPQVVEQILQLATQNGITGTVPPQSTRSAQEGATEEPQLPPLHQKAHDALEQGDHAAAAQAFEQALKENPGDEDARLGLAQVQLLQRTAELDVAGVRQAAAEHPDDVEAQKRVADVDVLGGHVEDAFSRLIRFIQTHAGDDREVAREHLVELFSIVGDSDPRVQKARKALARALF
ncbi:co-chaperone YbbN [Nesterenkonia alba]|uniref:co-chaperone YbbN n=1 Tax=Nesterenkonia alba TaxID=515814 RepID=UPI0003B7ABAC|nr:tetratricopeptide repeat protein [Nesterenkonia alba]